MGCEASTAASIWLGAAGVLATLVAAFLGPFIAFRLERATRIREEARLQKERAAAERERRLTASNRALYSLAKMFEILRNYRIRNVEQYRNDPARFINLPMTPPDAPPIISIDPASLIFVLEHGDGNAYHAVLLEEHRFRGLQHQIGVRTDILLNKVQPRFDAVGLPHEKALTRPQIADIIGAGQLAMLEVLTDRIIAETDANLVSLERAFLWLRAEVKSMYADAKLIAPAFDPSSKTNGDT